MIGRSSTDLRRTLGAAGRLWASPAHHEVCDEWWLACSGQRNVNYNVAFSQSSSPSVLVEHCLQPLLDLGLPAIIMLAGAGLATAQTLSEAGWVTVGALPLMTLTTRNGSGGDESDIRRLGADDLPAARELLSDTYGLDDGSAMAAVPDALVADDGLGAWGVFDGQQLASCFTGIVENGLFVVWSMATRRRRPGPWLRAPAPPFRAGPSTRAGRRRFAAAVVGGRAEALPGTGLRGGRTLAALVAAPVGHGQRLSTGSASGVTPAIGPGWRSGARPGRHRPGADARPACSTG